MEVDLMAQSGNWNGYVNRLYDACFYAVTVLLLHHNLSAGRHAGVRSLFNRHFVRTGVMATALGNLCRDIFESRQQGDYHDWVRFEAQ
jgi:uncharacterized protein (UPF0332 family)